MGFSCVALAVLPFFQNFAEVDPDKQSEQASIYSAILFGMGVVVAIAQLCQVRALAILFHDLCHSC